MKNQIVIKIISKLRHRKQRIIDYWFGDVSVSKQYIYCQDGKRMVHTISVIPSRFRKATWYRDIDIDITNKLIAMLKDCKKKLEFRLDYGCGMYQQYMFNKHQQKILLKKLTELIQTEEFYVENDEP